MAQKLPSGWLPSHFCACGSGRRCLVALPLPAPAAEAAALLRQAEEAAVAEALAAVTAAVESGDRTKVVAAQKVLEEVAAAAGIAVSALFLSARARSKQTSWKSCHVHVACSEPA